MTLERTLAEKNQKLRQTQAVLVETEKLASLGKLAAGMAHEINNPVAYVTNNLAVLKREVGSLVEVLEAYRRGSQALAKADPRLAAEVARMEQDHDLAWVQESLPRLFSASLDGLGRVRDIIGNLRDFARVDAAELDQFDLRQALQSTIEVLRHECERKQLSVRSALEEMPPVVCQPAKINQVFHNLLLNAIQASHPGGAIELSAAAEDGHVQVEIRDHGCGIDAVNLPHIFEPFFTTKDVGQGTGLGLATCYGILHDHGGSIEVDSQPGQGSTFRVRLPIEPRAVPGATPP